VFGVVLSSSHQQGLLPIGMTQYPLAIFAHNLKQFLFEKN